jgi:hypothetical protein
MPLPLSVQFGHTVDSITFLKGRVVTVHRCRFDELHESLRAISLNEKLRQGSTLTVKGSHPIRARVLVSRQEFACLKRCATQQRVGEIFLVPALLCFGIGKNCRSLIRPAWHARRWKPFSKNDVCQFMGQRSRQEIRATAKQVNSPADGSTFADIDER